MAKRGRGRTLDREEWQARWVAMSFGERRQITKLVSRGIPAEDVADAQMAHPLAVRQQRFWRFAWLLGLLPGITAAFTEPQPGLTRTSAVLGNAVFGLLLMGILSAWKYRNAKRAEAVNGVLLGIPADEAGVGRTRDVAQDRAERGPGVVDQLRTRFGRKEVPSSGRSEEELLGLAPEKGTPKPKVTATEQQPDLGKPREGIRSPATSAKKAKRRRRRR